MRMTYVVLPFVVAMTVGTVHATPVAYDITFSLDGGTIVPTSAFFTYDAANATFSDFLVQFNRVTIDLTAGANNGPYSASHCGVSANGAGSFAALTGASTCQLLTWVGQRTGPNPYIPSTPVTDIGFYFRQYSNDYAVAEFSGFTNGGSIPGSGYGTYVVSVRGAIPPVTAATPEPTPILMLATGLVAATLATRKHLN